VSAPDVAWTPTRIRQTEDDLVRGGVEERVAAAIDERTDCVVGFTTLQIQDGRPEYAGHPDTAVLAGHRRQGLGLAVKAAVLREASIERPELAEIATSVARSNKPMLGINRRLGFQDRRMTMNLAQPTSRLAVRLGIGD
jgi:mycothiol synthase